MAQMNQKYFQHIYFKYFKRYSGRMWTKRLESQLFIEHIVSNYRDFFRNWIQEYIFKPVIFLVYYKLLEFQPIWIWVLKENNAMRIEMQSCMITHLPKLNKSCLILSFQQTWRPLLVIRLIALLQLFLSTNRDSSSELE